jgi:hypothetical protein
LAIGYNQHPRRENKPYENTSGLDFLFFFKKIRGYPRRKYLEIKSKNINGFIFFKKIRGYPRRKYLEIKSKNINGFIFFLKKIRGYPPPAPGPGPGILSNIFFQIDFYINYIFT